MRAAVLYEPNQPMVIEDLRLQDPGPHEVLLRVAACGVCHTDLHVIKGEVRFPTPAVLGHEVSGIVEAVGADVSNVRPGDRVVCTFIMPCGQCYFCTRDREDLCSTFFTHNRLGGHLYDGASRLSRQDGSPVAMYSAAGLAEYAVTHHTAVFKLPDGYPLEEAAVIGCSVFTAYGAVRNQADLRPGQTVAVFAVGGVGAQVLQMARAFGASRVIAVDVRADKLEMALSLGATETVDSHGTDPVARIMELTDGRGVDVGIEALGLPVTVTQAFNSVRDGGRVVLVGIAPTGVEASLEITRIVRRGITVAGSYGAKARKDMPDILELVRRGLVDPRVTITRRYSLDEVNEAYASLSRGEIVGRALIRCASEG